MLVCCSLLLIGADPAPKPVASGTPPPEIYHVITTPLCARLHEKIRPAIALILENDKIIAKSPALFRQYGKAAFNAPSQDNSGTNGAPGGNDSINVDSPATNIALQRMSYLVSPIAQNLIATQKMLTDGVLDQTTGNKADDDQLAKIKASLLETSAFQSASLDLINGFVQTQQMGNLQHAGETYLNAINGTNTSVQMITPATPRPQLAGARAKSVRRRSARDPRASGGLQSADENHGWARLDAGRDDEAGECRRDIGDRCDQTVRGSAPVAPIVKRVQCGVLDWWA
jgi:hypothetical protein